MKTQNHIESKKTPSFEEFLQSKLDDEAVDRERLLGQFKKGLENGHSWMIECNSWDPTQECKFGDGVYYLFCSTRAEAEAIWKEESYKSFYDNTTWAFDLLTSALFPHKPQQNKDCKKTGALLFQYFSRI